MGFYVEVTQTPNRSGLAGEDIPAGTAVVIEDGEVTLADAENHDYFDGVADTPRTGEYIASFDHESSDFVYREDAEDDDNHATLGYEDSKGPYLVPVGGGDDGDIVRIRSQPDEDEAAPDIGDGDVVGFIDTSVADAPDIAGYVVEEGYEDDAGTTYDRDDDNFVAIGTAYRPVANVAPSDDGTVTDYDFPVRIRVNKGL